MRIETKQIAELMPADYNPRRALKPGSRRYDKLAKSLDAFGLVQPLVWNESSGRIVGGHQRWELLKARGEKEVAVVVVTLDPVQEKALNIALNNAEIGSEWDYGKLSDLVTELSMEFEFDTTLTGFDDRQLRDLLFVPESADSDRSDPNQSSRETMEVTICLPRVHWEHISPEVDRLLTFCHQVLGQDAEFRVREV